MGNVIFWIVFIGFILLIIISGIMREKSQREELLHELDEKYGSKDYVGLIPSKGSHKGYYERKLSEENQDIFFLDDITWNDLNLDLVFESLNGSLSSPGEEYLYYLLHSMKLKNDKVTLFRDIQKRINQDSDFRKNLQKGLSNIGKLNSLSAFGIINSLLEANTFSIKRDIILNIILVLSIFSIFISPGLGVIAFLLVLVISISSYFKGRAKMDENLRAFCYLQKIIRGGLILNDGLKEEFDIKDELKDLLRFSFLLPKKEGTSSDPFSLILDYLRMIFHVDVILFNLRLKSVIERKSDIISLYEKIAEYDAALAIASYTSYQPHICDPIFNEGNRVFEAESIYHPLTTHPVFNDIKEEKGALITGSNASGKSTFLKMVGLSILFSQSFGFAFADRIVLNHYRLYTSMALNDNILGKESYYIVESKSLKRICDEAGNNNNVFCIVDEVLRGTNTSERIAASCEILKFLKDKGVLVFTATHDTELTQLLEKDYSLYYFTEDVNESDVLFTYKIHEGVCNKTNAIRLLETIGYDERIIVGANNLVDTHRLTGKWGN